MGERYDWDGWLSLEVCVVMMKGRNGGTFELWMDMIEMTYVDDEKGETGLDWKDAR